METYFVETQQTNYVSHLRFWDCWSRNLVTPDTIKERTDRNQSTTGKIECTIFNLGFFENVETVETDFFYVQITSSRREKSPHNL